MKCKIVSDSSSNAFTAEHVPFASVPLHIIVGEEEFIDNAAVDLQHMEEALSSCTSSSTACPGTGTWLDAFGDAETIFCVTITSSLSGSYASAMMAKEEYERQYPDRHVYVIDSLSTGPEMVLIMEKLQELILSGMDGEQIFQEIHAYTQHTHLLFSLESLSNLAKNGRVSKTVAALAGILGIRVVGQASEKGELEMLSKCRGEQCTLSCIVKCMGKLGYTNGRIRIAHNNNEETARKLMTQIQESFDGTDIQIVPTGALCSYYAEKGGLLVGFEEKKEAAR